MIHSSELDFSKRQRAEEYRLHHLLYGCLCLPVAVYLLPHRLRMVFSVNHQSVMMSLLYSQREIETQRRKRSRD
jgi:hypothetical protein